MTLKDIPNQLEMSPMDLTWLGIFHWMKAKGLAEHSLGLCVFHWLRVRPFCFRFYHLSLYNREHTGRVTVEKEMSRVRVKTTIDLEDSDLITLLPILRPLDSF